jgi:hypothetical protein
LKKILSLLAIFAFSNIASATQILIINLSKDYSSEITYRFCEDHQIPHKKCSEPQQMTLVPVSKKSTSSQNYDVLIPPKSTTAIVIDKATETETDIIGPPVIAAQGIYTSQSAQSCRSEITDQDVAFMLNDNESIAITCLKSAY